MGQRGAAIVGGETRTGAGWSKVGERASCETERADTDNRRRVSERSNQRGDNATKQRPVPKGITREKRTSNCRARDEGVLREGEHGEHYALRFRSRTTTGGANVC